MNLRWLRPGELDHEALWLGVSVAAFLAVWAWLRLALPTPECTFHQVTGWPCPTCGLTRCVKFAFQSRWDSALGINPLGFATLAFVALFDLYAVIVLTLRLPRIRFDFLSPRTRTAIRFASVAAILANWGWLLWIRI